MNLPVVGYHGQIPLREDFIATNVPSFASLAPFAALRMASPRRTRSLASHCGMYQVGSMQCQRSREMGQAIMGLRTQGFERVWFKVK